MAGIRSTHSLYTMRVIRAPNRKKKADINSHLVFLIIASMEEII